MHIIADLNDDLVGSLYLQLKYLRQLVLQLQLHEACCMYQRVDYAARRRDRSDTTCDTLLIGWERNWALYSLTTINYIELSALGSLAIHRLHMTRAVKNLLMNFKYESFSPPKFSSTEMKYFGSH